MSTGPSTPENDPHLSALGRELLDSGSGSKPGSGPWVPPTAEELGKLLPDYEILKMLGRGGMGAVYMGRQKSLDRPVAIKILSTALEDADPSFAERFKNEARAMGKLTHPGIVAVYDFGEAEGGLLYIVMEYVDGTDVAKMIAANGRLHTEHAMAITAHVCDALAYAHERGIIHRDIKPANIMVGYDGVVKVADFGLAKMNKAGETGLTQSGLVMGTLHYMAPEALMLGSAVDQRADIYAVGVMLYHMLTGKLPQGLFELPSFQVPGLDPRYDGIIGKSLREDRDLRYPSVADMRHDLDAILTQPVVKVEAAAGAKPPAALNTQARPQRPKGQLTRPTQPQVIVRTEKKGSPLLWTAFIAMCSIAGWLFISHPNGRILSAPDQKSNADGNSSQDSTAVGASTMEVLVDTDFAESNKGFPNHKTNRIDAIWMDGHYQLTALSSAVWIPHQPAIQTLSLVDFVCEIEFRVPREASGNWGIGLGKKNHKSGDWWQAVRFDAAGRTMFPTPSRPDGQWFSTAAVPPGAGWNKLRLEGLQSRFKLFINDHLVTEVAQEGRVPPSEMSLFLQTSQPGFEVWFRRIRVWQPRK